MTKKECPYIDHGDYQSYCSITTMMCEDYRDGKYQECRVYKDFEEGRG